MNKRFFSLIFALSLLISNAFATVATYERTLDNLRVFSDIKVNDYNRDIILSTPSVNENEKVYDFANLFNSSEEQLLYNKVSEFINNGDLDMVIVTIDDNPRNSAMKYADDFYDYNYFGEGSTHDGILFLIDMDTREMWISTTGTGQLMYDDYRIEKILDATYSKITKEKYYECAEAFISNAKYYYELGIPDSNENAYINEYGDYVYSEDAIIASITVAALPAFIISLIIVFIMKGKHKTIKKATTAFSYMREKNITYREDSFINTYTSKVYDPPSSSSGSSGGGSSSHRSSSGRSHGGGGRRF